MKMLNDKRKGFTLIEAMTVLFIFVLITMTFYSMISIGSRHIINAKNRLGALSLANEKMEIARNVPYDDLGTDNGEVEGVLLEDEDVSKNTRQYHVSTSIVYVPDDFDGVFPADVAWNDYKKVEITVSWNTGDGTTDEVVLVSRFVPPGLEVADPNAGILMINVFSDQPGGTGISGADLHVVNTETGLDTDTPETGSDGSYMLMGQRVTDSIQKYQITVTKAGYETVQTLPPYPDTAYYPIDVHASVVTGALNVVNIVQNKLTDLTVESVDYLDQKIGDVNFALIGGRKLGIDASVPPIEKYNLEFTGSTESDGDRLFDDISPGKYELTPDLVSANYELIGVDPSISFELFSDNPLTVKMRLAEKTKTGMMVKVVRDGIFPIEAIENATVRITKGVFTDELTTSANGAVYFPKDATPLEAGIYDVHVTSVDYGDEDFQVTVSENVLSVETANMAAPI
jgi:competence protein ComGC